MTRTRNARKLTVTKETLRVLSSGDLEKVQGGLLPAMLPKNNCTLRYSGCISQI